MMAHEFTVTLKSGREFTCRTLQAGDFPRLTGAMPDLTAELMAEAMEIEDPSERGKKIVSTMTEQEHKDAMRYMTSVICECCLDPLMVYDPRESLIDRRTKPLELPDNVIECDLDSQETGELYGWIQRKTQEVRKNLAPLSETDKPC